MFLLKNALKSPCLKNTHVEKLYLSKRAKRNDESWAESPSFGR
ncbi:hypothetical protein BN1221_00263 [Brenneria goodwinii]|uniref:Uncharacterized protein n=1 Tax=Brenneria goodwinii TaxID=1109412 RepID=A0A0G4JPK3_9GAMM|nr:hypothetical protein BN1221_00263 [Brenneria goodwinii]